MFSFFNWLASSTVTSFTLSRFETLSPRFCSAHGAGHWVLCNSQRRRGEGAFLTPNQSDVGVDRPLQVPTPLWETEGFTVASWSESPGIWSPLLVVSLHSLCTCAGAELVRLHGLGTGLGIRTGSLPHSPSTGKGDAHATSLPCVSRVTKRALRALGGSH